MDLPLFDSLVKLGEAYGMPAVIAPVSALLIVELRAWRSSIDNLARNIGYAGSGLHKLAAIAGGSGAALPERPPDDHGGN